MRFHLQLNYTLIVWQILLHLIISKSTSKYKVVKTIGSSFNEKEIFEFELKAKQEIKKLEFKQSLFIFENDSFVQNFLSETQNSQIRTIGSALITKNIILKMDKNQTKLIEIINKFF